MKKEFVFVGTFANIFHFFKKLFRGELFSKKTTLSMEPVEKRALLFAINNYPGSQNDLNGCKNDQKDWIRKLRVDYKDFDIRAYTDSAVTRELFRDEVAAAIAVLPAGATVIILMDCCYSGDITKYMQSFISPTKHPIKSRFYNPGLTAPKRYRRRMLKTDIRKTNWLVISGCGEHQTSADAYIDGKYNGAFTYYSLKALEPGMTFQQWYDEIKKYLPGDGFNQAPEPEGPTLLRNRVLFEGPTLLIHYSGHGTYVPCKEGDEADGVDEAIYFYNGAFTDDEFNKLLVEIK
jgi:hypothetical protein